MNRRFQPDPHRNRKAIPYTRSEYESWGREREMGRPRAIRQSIIVGALVTPATLALCTLVFILAKGIELPAGWPFLAAFYGTALVIGGAFFGWFKGGQLWQIAEDRYAATERSDLDDEDLIDESNDQRLIAWTLLPGGIGIGLSVLLPERFMSLFWVGVGITMVAFAYICLRSKHAFKEGRDDDGETIGRAKTVFILIGGIVSFCAGIYGLVSYVPVVGD